MKEITLSPDIAKILFSLGSTAIRNKGFDEEEVDAWGMAIARGKLPDIETRDGKPMTTIQEFEEYMRNRIAEAKNNLENKEG